MLNVLAWKVSASKYLISASKFVYKFLYGSQLNFSIRYVQNKNQTNGKQKYLKWLIWNIKINTKNKKKLIQ